MAVSYIDCNPQASLLFSLIAKHFAPKPISQIALNRLVIRVCLFYFFEIGGKEKR